MLDIAHILLWIINIYVKVTFFSALIFKVSHTFSQYFRKLVKLHDHGRNRLNLSISIDSFESKLGTILTLTIQDECFDRKAVGCNQIPHV